jgi:hypothetical protein
MKSNKTTLFLLLLSVSIFTACNANQTPQEESTNESTTLVERDTNDNGITDSSNNTSNDSNPTNSQTDRIARTQQELLDRQTSQSISKPVGYKLDFEPYKYFTDANGYLNLLNVDINEVDRILGAAPVVMKQSREGAPVRREVRVYMPYDEDPTGLYIYFLNDKVESFRMDEFNGITNSSILEYFN